VIQYYRRPSDYVIIYILYDIIMNNNIIRLLLFFFFLCYTFFVCSWRYRKFVKPVFDRLTAVLHRQRVVPGLFDRIVDQVRAIVFRHDFCVYEITEIIQTCEHTTSLKYFAKCFATTHFKYYTMN
jgi:hypothetical protein